MRLLWNGSCSSDYDKITILSGVKEACQSCIERTLQSCYTRPWIKIKTLPDRSNQWSQNRIKVCNHTYPNHKSTERLTWSVQQICYSHNYIPANKINSRTNSIVLILHHLLSSFVMCFFHFYCIYFPYFMYNVQVGLLFLNIVKSKCFKCFHLTWN